MSEMSTGQAVMAVRWWSRGRAGWRPWRRADGEAGMTTAEYAVGTLVISSP